MNTTKIANLLDRTQQQFEAKKAALEKQFDEKRSALLGKVKVELVGALVAARKIYDSIPKDAREDVLSESSIAKVLKSFGSPAKSREAGKPRKPRKGNVLDADYLGYLQTERSTGDVADYFKVSAVTVSNRLGALLKAKKVTMRKDTEDKRKKFWKAA
jgi:hypothetical protein